MKIENAVLKQDFELVDNLTQGMLERFEAHLVKDNATGEGIKTTHGKFLRAAIAVGWVVEPRLNNDQIAAMNPQIIAMIGRHLVKEYNEASIVPNA